MHGLALQAKPLNLDTLQLFVALMAVLPFVLWAMLRRPNLTLAASAALYVTARVLDWSLPAFPTGTWYFNPFCWQLLSVLGAWFAVNGARLTAWAQRMPWLRIAAFVYLGFALIVTVSSHVPALAGVVPDLGLDLLAPSDKENLAVYRVVHLLALALLFNAAACHDVRRGMARLVLRRRVPVLCRPLRADHPAQFDRDPGAGQHRGHRDHDGGRLLHRLVAEAG
jgi:hypothetical protein